VFLAQENYPSAKEVAEVAAERLRDQGDPVQERRCFFVLGVALRHLGQLEDASLALEHAVAVSRQLHDPFAQGELLSVLGGVLDEVGLHERAIPHFNTALGLLPSAGARGKCMIRWGWNRVCRGEGGGVGDIRRGIDLARGANSNTTEAFGLVLLAQAHLHRGEWEEASAQAAIAAQHAASARSLGLETRALAYRAEALRRVGRASEAHLSSARAAELLERQPHLGCFPEEILSTHARTLLAIGSTTDAEALWSSAVAGISARNAGFIDPAWRAAFSNIPVVKALVDGGLTDE
jgi:tetratricopeptide (TPR) repeat protein